MPSMPDPTTPEDHSISEEATWRLERLALQQDRHGSTVDRIGASSSRGYSNTGGGLSTLRHRNPRKPDSRDESFDVEVSEVQRFRDFVRNLVETKGESTDHQYSIEHGVIKLAQYLHLAGSVSAFIDEMQLAYSCCWAERLAQLPHPNNKLVLQHLLEREMDDLELQFAQTRNFSALDAVRQQRKEMCSKWNAWPLKHWLAAFRIFARYWREERTPDSTRKGRRDLTPL